MGCNKLRDKQAITKWLVSQRSWLSTKKHKFEREVYLAADKRRCRLNRTVRKASMCATRSREFAITGGGDAGGWAAVQLFR